MMIWLAILVGTLLACEVGLRLPLPAILSRLNGSVRQAKRVVTSGVISDHWKEKTLPAYSGRIMMASLKLFGCLILIALPVVVLAAIATGSLAAGSALLMRPLPLVAMIVIGLGYVMLRQRVLR